MATDGFKLSKSDAFWHATAAIALGLLMYVGQRAGLWSGMAAYADALVGYGVLSIIGRKVTSIAKG
jgi:hypothetical protein